MIKGLKNKVLKFMQFCDTKSLNTNNFILDFYRYQYGFIDIDKVRNGPSFESISRARRFLIAKNPELVFREESSKDKQEVYRETFKRDLVHT